MNDKEGKEIKRAAMLVGFNKESRVLVGEESSYCDQKVGLPLASFHGLQIGRALFTIGLQRMVSKVAKMGPKMGLEFGSQNNDKKNKNKINDTTFKWST